MEEFTYAELSVMRHALRRFGAQSATAGILAKLNRVVPPLMSAREGWTAVLGETWTTVVPNVQPTGPAVAGTTCSHCGSAVESGTCTSASCPLSRKTTP